MYRKNEIIRKVEFSGTTLVFGCRCCDSTFRSRDELLEHMDRIHLSSGFYLLPDMWRPSERSKFWPRMWNTFFLSCNLPFYACMFIPPITGWYCDLTLSSNLDNRIRHIVVLSFDVLEYTVQHYEIVVTLATIL